MSIVTVAMASALGTSMPVIGPANMPAPTARARETELLSSLMPSNRMMITVSVVEHELSRDIVAALRASVFDSFEHCYDL